MEYINKLIMKTWTTKEGKEIKIKDMETSHLINCIKMLERRAEKGEEIVVSYGYDGDDDYMTGDVEFVQGKDFLVYTDYKYLIAELKRRNTLRPSDYSRSI